MPVLLSELVRNGKPAHYQKVHYDRNDFEVEIKRVWSGPEFKYDTLQIPERKKKVIGRDMPCVFAVFNNEQTHGFLCPGDILAVSPLVEVSNKYVRSGEMFFQVPISSLIFIEVPSDIQS